MNRDDERPDDDLPDIGKLPDHGSRAKLERLLKAARPCPPRLDLAAIERLARETPAQADGPSLAETPKAGWPSRTRGRGQRPYAAIAGSWICGALVGAICMFWYEGPSAPTTGRNPSTAHVAEDLPRVVITDRNTTSTPANGQLNANASITPGKMTPGKVTPGDTYATWSDIDSPVFALLLDLNRRGGVGNERPGGILRARMHLSGLAENVWGDAGPVDAQGDLPKDGVTTPHSGAMSDQDTLRASPPVTRERLLRELQGDTARGFL
ncbi:MAG: hypothetical protein ACYC3X_19520 [Pirellulaceae bacterium]